MIEVGYVARPHGLRGEVVVVLTTDREERVAAGTTLYTEAGPLVVQTARGAQRTTDKQRWIVRFADVLDRESADALRGAVLLAEPLDDPDTMWAHDVVGAEVVLLDDETPVGSCVAVIANPAADLLELDNGALVPVVFVVRRSPGRVVIDPPEGLFDL